MKKYLRAAAAGSGGLRSSGGPGGGLNDLR